MGFKVADRVKERTVTTGTGSITLTGDFIDGFQSFASGISSGDTTFYLIDEKVLNSSDHWEVGIGVFNSGILSRDTVLSSSLGSDRIDLNGSGIVSITYPSEHAIFLNDELYTYVGSGVNFISDTTKYLVGNSGNIYYDNRQLAYLDEATSSYASGIATYASGQSISNQYDISYISGISVYASGQTVKQYENISSNTILEDVPDIIFVDSVASEINVYMPTAVGNGGKEIKIKRAYGNNLVTIHASGTETIDGQANYHMHHLYESSTFVSNNTSWFLT